MRMIRALTLAAALGVSLAPASVGQTSFSVLYNIPNGNPLGLTPGNGVFYGTTWDGAGAGSTCGTIFEMVPPGQSGGAWTENILHSFTHGNGDACIPAAPPVLGTAGVLYGVTYHGGAHGHGAVYEVQPPASSGDPWTESVVYSFTTPGASPKTTSSLVISPSGALYMATLAGGANGAGALIELQPPAAAGGVWTETTLYSFPAGAGNPTSLFADPASGNLYGTIAYGGTGPTKAGAVFQLTPPSAPGGTWTEALIYNFQGFTDGSTPNFVTPGPGGILYGTTYGTTYIHGGAGPIGAGTVYELDPPASPGASWTKTILYTFGNGLLHGPNSPPLLANGNVYGSSSANTGGMVFELQPPSAPGGAWTLTSLHTFTNGDIPNGIFIMEADGTIYGATEAQATAPFAGTIYEITQ